MSGPECSRAIVKGLVIYLIVRNLLGVVSSISGQLTHSGLMPNLGYSGGVVGGFLIRQSLISLGL